MVTSVFKVFFSKEKEQNWLNSMGEKGFLLTSINDSKYSFTKSDEEDHTYCYSIEYLCCSPKSEDATDYYKSREQEGIVPLVSSGNWVYFAKTDGNIAPNADVYKKNSVYYFWRTLYLLFFAICGAVVCGYQAFAIDYLKQIGYHGSGQITKVFELSDKKGFTEAALNLFRNIGNIFFKMLNRYFKVWTDIFGESDAIAVISIVAPITIILLIIGALNLERYISYRKQAKQLGDKKTDQFKKPEGNICAE